MTNMAGRVVLVTGGSGNLGSACAEAVAADGGGVVLVDRDEARLRARHQKLAGDPRHLMIGGVDLTSPAEVERAVGRVVERFGRIDGLVNTVGGFAGGAVVHEEDPGTFARMFALNFTTALLTCRAVIPHMLAARRGSIVNVGSRDALRPRARYAAYGLSKAAVLHLTAVLSDEVRSRGVRVNCVLPGTMDTPENRAAMPDADTSGWVAPSAVAETIRFLLSDGARAVHGAAIPVTGTG